MQRNKSYNWINNNTYIKSVFKEYDDMVMSYDDK
jgi:hypothetical protein